MKCHNFSTGVFKHGYWWLGIHQLEPTIALDLQRVSDALDSSLLYVNTSLRMRLDKPEPLDTGALENEKIDVKVFTLNP